MTRDEALAKARELFPGGFLRKDAPVIRKIAAALMTAFADGIAVSITMGHQERISTNKSIRAEAAKLARGE